MAELPKDSSPEALLRWVIAHETEVTQFWKTLWDLKLDDRLKDLERNMVTHDQVRESVDRSEGRTAKNIEAIGVQMKESFGEITQSLEKIPEDALRMMDLKFAASQGETKKMSNTAVGGILGTIMAGVVACAAALRSVFGGE